MDDERYTNPVYKTWLSLMAKEQAHGYESLSAAERVFWCVYLLDMEIYNGYFDQYFFNSSSDYASGIVAALHTIRAQNAAQITHEVINYVFPDGVVPEDRDKRQMMLEVAEERDSSYYERTGAFSREYCKDDDKVYTLLEEYARQQGFVVV